MRLSELHIKYGHTVRIAPNELSFTSDTAWKTVYGHRSLEMGKDPVYSLDTPTDAQGEWKRSPTLSDEAIAQEQF